MSFVLKFSFTYLSISRCHPAKTRKRGSVIVNLYPRNLYVLLFSYSEDALVVCNRQPVATVMQCMTLVYGRDVLGRLQAFHLTLLDSCLYHEQW